jgi:hypothetical protein
MIGLDLTRIEEFESNDTSITGTRKRSKIIKMIELSI